MSEATNREALRAVRVALSDTTFRPLEEGEDYVAAVVTMPAGGEAGDLGARAHPAIRGAVERMEVIVRRALGLVEGLDAIPLPVAIHRTPSEHRYSLMIPTAVAQGLAERPVLATALRVAVVGYLADRLGLAEDAAGEAAVPA